MTKPYVVSARGIRKTLGEGAGQVEALKGVSLTIHPGELTLLMGPSGSGKTTLLSILGCLLTPTAGTLAIAGNRTDQLSGEQLATLRREHIGFVFQSYNLFPTLNAMENTAICLDVRGISPSEARRRALEALEAVGMSHRVNAFPKTLSGGEKQRVAIARALVGSPSVILADEPTSALDAENGQAVMKLLSEMSRSNERAVLAVTHDHRIEKFADRIVKIEDGLIVDSEDNSEKHHSFRQPVGVVEPIEPHLRPKTGSAPRKKRRTAK